MQIHHAAVLVLSGCVFLWGQSVSAETCRAAGAGPFADVRPYEGNTTCVNGLVEGDGRVVGFTTLASGEKIEVIFGGVFRGGKIIDGTLRRIDGKSASVFRNGQLVSRCLAVQPANNLNCSPEQSSNLLQPYPLERPKVSEFGGLQTRSTAQPTIAPDVSSQKPKTTPGKPEEFSWDKWLEASQPQKNVKPATSASIQGKAPFTAQQAIEACQLQLTTTAQTVGRIESVYTVEVLDATKPEESGLPAAIMPKTALMYPVKLHILFVGGERKFKQVFVWRTPFGFSCMEGG